MRRHTSLSNRLPQDFIWLLEQRTTYSAFWLLCSICLENNSNALLWSRTGENEASCHHKLHWHDRRKSWHNRYCGVWSLSGRNSIKWRRLKVDPQKSEPVVHSYKLLYQKCSPSSLLLLPPSPWVSLSLPPARTIVALAQFNVVRIAFFVAANVGFTDTCLKFQALPPRQLLPRWLPSLPASLALLLPRTQTSASLALISPAFSAVALPGI